MIIPGVVASGQAAVAAGGGSSNRLTLGGLFLKLGADQLVLGA
jgi:hypothetical protein